jgi:hypothetical protein
MLTRINLWQTTTFWRSPAWASCLLLTSFIRPIPAPAWTHHPPHDKTSRPQVAAAKANFDGLFFYLKTSHTIEICDFTADEANKAAVKANPVLFNLPESQCAKAISAVDDFETGAGKDLLSKCNSVVTEAPTDRGAE